MILLIYFTFADDTENKCTFLKVLSFATQKMFQLKQHDPLYIKGIVGMAGGD